MSSASDASSLSDAATCTREDFDCKMCGHCCLGKGGIVVSSTDLSRLLAHLQLDTDAFEAAYCEWRSGKRYICSGDGGYCLFFEQGKGCSVHSAKPDICRAWPYFRGNLVDSESLELAKDFCPGIPAGIPHAEFVRQGLACLMRDGLVREHGPDGAGALRVADLYVKSCADNKAKA